MLKIGVFDSGLGGLTVVQALSKVIKGAELCYIADTKHAPYGEKNTQQILQYSLDITNHFIKNHNIDALVVACNTATSAAIKILREKYPELIIVGTEPAIKPAIEQTKTGNVGVMATPATLSGDKYQQLVDKLSLDKNVKLYEQACPGLVEKIENGKIESTETENMLRRWLIPMQEKNVDTIVLGCTHYPLISYLIRKVMGDDIVLLDAGEGIASRLYKLLPNHLNVEENMRIKVFSTGNIDYETVSTLLKQKTMVTLIKID